jgi:predicted aldo/keto reductase-like oxidoreductase
LKLLRTKEAAREHVRYGLDLGLNYWDCTHSYWEGNSEEVYGDALAPHRKELFLTSKSTKRTAREAEAELHKTLDRYRSDYVDLWQLHGVNTPQDVETTFGPCGAIEALTAAKKSGKARFIGITGHADPFVLNDALDRFDGFDAILMPLHAADPAYLSFEENTLPKAVERGMAIQAMKVFGNAFLLRVLSARECLQYSLSLPIHCATVGCSSTSHFDDDLKIVQALRNPLSEDEMARIREIAVTEGPGGATGPALEYWKRADG